MAPGDTAKITTQTDGILHNTLPRLPHMGGIRVYPGVRQQRPQCLAVAASAVRHACSHGVASVVNRFPQLIEQSTATYAEAIKAGLGDEDGYLGPEAFDMCQVDVVSGWHLAYVPGSKEAEQQLEAVLREILLQPGPPVRGLALVTSGDNHYRPVVADQLDELAASGKGRFVYLDSLGLGGSDAYSAQLGSLAELTEHIACDLAVRAPGLGTVQVSILELAPAAGEHA